MSIASGEAELGNTNFTMTTGEWTAFSTWIFGNEHITLTFTPGRRFFLDEFLIKKPSTTNIDHSSITPDNVYPIAYYSLAGQQFSHPITGICIVKYSDGTCKKQTNAQ